MPICFTVSALNATNLVTAKIPPHPKIPAASSTIFASASCFAPRTGLKYLTFKSLNPQNAKI